LNFGEIFGRFKTIFSPTLPEQQEIAGPAASGGGWDAKLAAADGQAAALGRMVQGGGADAKSFQPVNFGFTRE